MNELDEILLLKYLQNNCSEEELAIVNSWMNLSKDNRNRLLEMERIWHSGDKIRFAKESHILRAEKLLYSRIKDKIRSRHHHFIHRNILCDKLLRI